MMLLDSTIIFKAYINILYIILYICTNWERSINHKQGTNADHNVRGGLLIDLIIVAIALLLRYTLSMSLKLTDIKQWNVSAVVLEKFLLLTKWYLSEYW